jgi:hypothetical protein
MTNIKNTQLYRRLCMLLIITGAAVGLAARRPRRHPRHR